ncbi:MAG TPA: NAD(P)/FAD-dependent oxidoreductase [Pseudonocardia sp.]|nr:NAD(P)/FAD-dependent oxidoreductase [Pseudonocardia sp.]
MSRRREPRIAIIGAGMSGICTAAKLQRAGIHDFVLYEKADQVGGTWRANTYPGLSCDVPSRYYSYTFAPNPDWTRLFSPGGEIRDYLRRVAAELGIDRHIRFGTEVDEAEWTQAGQWRVRTKHGDEETFDFIFSASGVLHHPRTPEIPGLDSFAGAVFHSARWDHSVPLDGRRVAVIGTGSTGVQITKALAPRCSSYTLFQRTPQWVFPIPNPRYSTFTRGLLKRFPAVNRRWGRLAYRFWQEVFERSFCLAVIRPGWQRRLITALSHAHLYRVRDRRLRERLRPSDKPMCKRMIFASGFYERFQRGEAELVDTAIDHVTERGIVTTDGRLHELDVIVLATGFDAHAYLRPVELIGPDGLRLSKVWSDEPRGYRTVALPGFPNFFLLLGPNSPIGNQSLFMITETQVDYALRWIERWRAGDFDSATPRDDATEGFMAEMRSAFPQTIWTSGCDSWYLGKDGLPALWPFSPKAHRDMLATPHTDEWELTTTADGSRTL